jgi:hypothetical protein
MTWTTCFTAWRGADWKAAESVVTGRFLATAGPGNLTSRSAPFLRSAHTFARCPNVLGTGSGDDG